MDDLVGISEAAKVLGCHHTLIYYRIKQADFPASVIVAGRTLFHRADIEKYAKKRPLRAYNGHRQTASGGSGQ